MDKQDVIPATTSRQMELFRHIPPGEDGEPRGHCEACAAAIWSAGAFRIPQLAGLYCSLVCIEAKLFGLNHCRWCGDLVDRSYLSITSRLCCEDCETNYSAHVQGDHAAELGSGKRFLAWLARRPPALYCALVGDAARKVSGGFSKHTLGRTREMVNFTNVGRSRHVQEAARA